MKRASNGSCLGSSERSVARREKNKKMTSPVRKKMMINRNDVRWC
jgi:hypothetical protein